jgi:hypothetical protein
MRYAGHVAHVGSRIGVYRILVEYPEGKRPLGMPGARWEDNIKVDLWDMDWIDLIHNMNRWQVLVLMVMNMCVP